MKKVCVQFNDLKKNDRIWNFYFNIFEKVLRKIGDELTQITSCSEGSMRFRYYHFCNSTIEAHNEKQDNKEIFGARIFSPHNLEIKTIEKKLYETFKPYNKRKIPKNIVDVI